MENILDLVTIKIDIKISGSLLAKVTLNWQDEFEVRFCRITKRPNGSLWFQPPALKEFNYAKCFGVIDKEKWNKLENKVITIFKAELLEQTRNGIYDESILNQINEIERQKISPEEEDRIFNEIEKMEVQPM